MISVAWIHETSIELVFRHRRENSSLDGWRDIGEEFPLALSMNAHKLL